MRVSAAVLFAGVLAMCAGGAGAAQPSFYDGKQVTLIAPTSAGSGYDAYARTVARTLPNHIPGHPAILVQNMPGAGGIRAANYLYNVAAKDGLTIGELQNGVPLEPFY
jgi:tripartite-type tricarboxylate transporter receptor subunit TctC